MGTKRLFVLVSDGGDGSYSTHYTFNEEWIQRREAKGDYGELEHGDLGCDGDGFHYDTLTVPEESTLESLGIHYDCADDDD